MESERRMDEVVGVTATDTIRAMLDERGVEWDYGITGSTTTKFRVNGIDLTFTPMRDGLVCSTILTPEQAIEATLGRGECEVEYVSDWMGWHCKACDMLWQGLRDQRPHFCPNCGRKVRA